MYKGVYLISAVVVCVAAITYCCPSCLLIGTFGILTLLGIITSVVGVVWVHILLSSPHKTGVGIEYAYKEQEFFRNKLMVRSDELKKLILVFLMISFRKILIILTHRKVLKTMYLLYLEELLIVSFNSFWIMLLEILLCIT